MKRRRASPGLKWSKRVNPPQPYWVASQVVRDTHGYSDKTIRLGGSACRAVVKGEHGLPMRERSYRKWFRQIARADEVWSMDSRAGGATEAEQAGAPRSAIQA
jgi:hypothetical protein